MRNINFESWIKKVSVKGAVRFNCFVRAPKQLMATVFNHNLLNKLRLLRSILTFHFLILSIFECAEKESLCALPN